MIQKIEKILCINCKEFNPTNDKTCRCQSFENIYNTIEKLVREKNKLIEELEERKKINK